MGMITDVQVWCRWQTGYQHRWFTVDCLLFLFINNFNRSFIKTESKTDIGGFKYIFSVVYNMLNLVSDYKRPSIICSDLFRTIDCGARKTPNRQYYPIHSKLLRDEHNIALVWTLTHTALKRNELTDSVTEEASIYYSNTKYSDSIT